MQRLYAKCINVHFPYTAKHLITLRKATEHILTRLDEAYYNYLMYS